MFNPMKPYISFCRIEFANGVRPVRILAAIHAAAGKQRGQFRNSNTIKLFVKDVIQPLLQIGNLILQSANQALSDLPEEHAAFAGWVCDQSNFDTKEYVQCP